MSDEQIKTLKRQIDQINKSISKMAGDTPKTLFKDIARKYLKTKSSSSWVRDSTKAVLKNEIENYLIPAFGEYALDEITNSIWLTWVNEVRKDSKRSQFFNARKVLVAILGWSRIEGLLDKVPQLEDTDVKREVGRSLSQKEVLTIIWHSNRPFRFIFYTFWKMGCRPREILQWKWKMIEWVEPGQTWISIPAEISKTNRARKIPINPEVSSFLYRRFQKGNGSEFVFPREEDPLKPQRTYNTAWDRVAKKCKIKAVPYDLRRTFVSRCAAEGKPLLYVAKLLDSSIDMLEHIYAKTQADTMEKIVK